MKILSILCYSFFFFCAPAFARDFIVEFVEENYKEASAQFSNESVIYHSIQVHSSSGPKLLILTGEAPYYRKWLRYYISQNKKIIAKIPEDRMEEFVSAKAYEIDMTSLHPFNSEKWEEPTDSRRPTIEGNNNILIIDPDDKRTNLIQLILKKMGYSTTIFTEGNQAWNSFRLNPAKFKMIIAHHTIHDISPDIFIKKALTINHVIPIIIDTGYKNQKLKNDFMSKFSGFKSVHVTSAILNELEKTIETLLRKNA